MSTITNFRISSELKNVIGRDLITDDFVAIFELVKNSFDAKATEVKIVFDFTPGLEAICIIDNGKGMSSDDIKNKWLFVAYSAKKDGSEDEISTGQHYAGNKGVGRFSCDRLGRFLHIETKTVDSDEINIIDVDWGNFEKNAKKEFGKIPISIDTANDFSPLDCMMEKNTYSGVILKIFGLRSIDIWTANKIIELKRALSKLLDPFNGDISDRRIEIISQRDWDYDTRESERARRAGEDPITVNGNVENKLFELIETKTTTIKAKIENAVLKVELIDRGMLIYGTEENIKDDYPLLLDVDFNAIIAFLNSAAKNIFTRRMGLPSVQYGSLFLIRNGFRVFPVGEEADDFWGFDRRKQQGFKRYIGTREIQGRVNISANDLFDERFKEASSRNQGLISSAAVDELKNCVMHCVRKLEAYLTTVTWLDLLDKEEDTPIRLSRDENKQRIIQLVEKLSLSPKIKVTYYNKDIVSILSNKSEQFETSLESLKKIAHKSNDPKLLGEIDRAEQQIRRQQKALEESKKIAQQEMEARQRAESSAIIAENIAKKAKTEKDVAEKQYVEERKRNLFLTASSDRDKDVLEGFLHQITICTADSKTALENALIALQSEDLPKDQIRNIITDQIEILENISTLSKFGTFANFRLASGQINDDISLFIDQYIEKVAKGFESRIEIKCINSGGSFITTFNPMEIGMVLDNLISNSKKARATQFSVSIDKLNDNLILKIVDNGKGIIEASDRIFEKGFTRTNGSGIGLYFCRKLLDKIHANIELTSPQPTKGASFTIRIKK